MDEITKRIVRRSMRQNPDLPVRFIINCIRIKQRVSADMELIEKRIKDGKPRVKVNIDDL